MAAGYKPLKVTGNSTGLIQSREEFILVDDAYPVLENAFVWRERIKRKQGYKLLGRLQRNLVSASLGTINPGGAGTTNYTIFLRLMINTTEPNASLVPGNATSPIIVTLGAPISQTLTDSTGLGVMTISPAGLITAATINYQTGILTLTFSGASGGPAAMAITTSYYPNLPVMGIRIQERDSINNEDTIFFDTKYAYKNLGGFSEFITGTTWTGTDSDFFWSTNYWVAPITNQKLFWVTNFNISGAGDPIRYTDNSTWTPFAPIVNTTGATLNQCLTIVPYRSRLVVCNTYEGLTFAGSTQFFQRIRWSAIGNPLVADAWRDDIRGKGGFIDIPTSQAIVSVGFVRDNLVIYCERSTWQLRYTGRSIAPFQIEKVNTELGCVSTFSAVQFDTSLVGIGDQGVVECDSFKSERIDIKIPDLIYQFTNINFGPARVQGIRDLQQRLAFWTYPNQATSKKFPDRRLVYNYENDSWAIFTDSLTTLGKFQLQSDITWVTADDTWENLNITWVSRPSLFPSIVGGNQQGFIELLDWQVSNDPGLYIQAITGNTTTPTVITSPDHNLISGQIIQILQIPAGTGYSTRLNNGIFQVQVVDSDNFQLWLYSSTDNDFSIPQLDTPAIYVGNGVMEIRDNFRIVSKKFNFMDLGQKIQIGYIDLLMDATSAGAISLNVYIDYDDNTSTNLYPQNVISGPDTPDTFFNSVIPTTISDFSVQDTSKVWQRVICPTRANFITLEYTLSNAQMVGNEQTSNVQIDAQTIWQRPAGRETI